MASTPKKRHLDHLADRPSPKWARKELTLDQKLKLIADSERIPKFTQKELSEKYGIGRTTVSDVLRRKAFYREQYEANTSTTKIRFAN